MLGQGISIPDIQGIANLKPKWVYITQQFTTTGQQWLRSADVPDAKIRYVTYSSLGFNVGDISDCLYQLEYTDNSRAAILAMFPDLTVGDTKNIFAAFWIPEKYHLAVRFNVVATSPTAWLTAMYLEFTTGGY